MSPMHLARCNFGSFCDKFSKIIYVFGGRSNESFLDSIEKYSIFFNQWEIINFILPQPISHFSFTQTNSNSVVIIGGKNTDYQNDIYEINFKEKKIHQLI